jgi:SAM-dependent methyltransferase
VFVSFKDHFSRDSDQYLSYRPRYPDTLFRWLSTIASRNELAWDCATGTGQAAGQLAQYFDRVVATDASEQQIAQARSKKNIDYQVATETCKKLSPTSVDLITVAQALHWFDTSVFFQEVSRVLKPGGALAVWSYNLLRVNADIDGVIDKLYWDILAPYWPAERRLVEQGYAGLTLPYDEIDSPDFRMSHMWAREHFLGYLATWSAVKRYKDKTRNNPLKLLEDELINIWPDGQALEVKWPLSLKVAIRPFAG